MTASRKQIQQRDICANVVSKWFQKGASVRKQADSYFLFPFLRGCALSIVLRKKKTAIHFFFSAPGRLIMPQLCECNQAQAKSQEGPQTCISAMHSTHAYTQLQTHRKLKIQTSKYSLKILLNDILGSDLGATRCRLWLTDTAAHMDIVCPDCLPISCCLLVLAGLAWPIADDLQAAVCKENRARLPSWSRLCPHPR